MDKLLQLLSVLGQRDKNSTDAFFNNEAMFNIASALSGPICSLQFDLFVTWFQTALNNIAAEVSPVGSAVRQASSVGVIPVTGVITPRKMSYFETYGLTTSVDTIRTKLSLAMANESVKKILMVYDTPGGNTFGVNELATELQAASLKKPIVGQVEYMAASAGYWLASQSTQLIAAPSALVGSIGAYMTHVDDSKFLENMGIGVEFVSAGKDKLLGTHGPLTEEARDYLQGLVDVAYTDFTGAVARGRNVSKATAAGEQFGAGRVLVSNDALKAGMIDKVATLSDTIKRLDSPGARMRNKRRALNLMGVIR